MRMLKYYIRRIFPSLRPSSPYISGNDRLKCIFIHIPKCAGISIEKALFEEKVGHHRYLDYKVCDPLRCANYVKFTVVRDPIDRFFSAFYFLKRGGLHSIDAGWSEKYMSDYEHPREFIRALMKDRELAEIVFCWQHFRPQVAFLEDELRRIDVDYILRFENLASDFAEFTKKIGVKADLPHANETLSKGTSAEDLTHLEIGFLKEIYAVDYVKLMSTYKMRNN